MFCAGCVTYTVLDYCKSPLERPLLVYGIFSVKYVPLVIGNLARRLLHQHRCISMLIQSIMFCDGDATFQYYETMRLVHLNIN